MGNKRKVYLAAINYPYCGAINFIDPELKYLRKYFDVVIVSVVSESDYEKYRNREKIYAGIEIIRYHNTINLFDCLRYGVQGISDYFFRQEVKEILSMGRNVFPRIRESLSFYIRAGKYRDFLKQFLLNEEEAVYYSYWYTDLCYGAIQCKRQNKKLKVITRAHGVDLYNERTLGMRQPFKRQMDKEIDRVLFASQYGMDYYIDHFSGEISEKKYCLCRLGSEKTYAAENQKKSPEFVLASCSYAIPLKRIDRIINALALIDDFEIYWIHFGGGELYDELVALAKDKLSRKNNISYSMPGHLDNKEIWKFYRENRVDCFITTTTSEGGCPVSIQEAMQFGIPVIGTDVGGVTEMIQGNGILLDKEPTEEQISRAINEMCGKEDEEIMQMRKCSQKVWEKYFDIAKNGAEVVEILKAL